MRKGEVMGNDTGMAGPGSAWGPGEQRLRAAVRSHARRRRARQGPGPPHLQPRTDDPKPYDDDWGWWIEFRLGRIEAQIRWLLALAAGALLAEVVRVALTALGLT